MSKKQDEQEQIEKERELIMGALEELFAENEANVRNSIASKLAVHLVGNDSEHDKAIELAMRIVRDVEE